MKRDDVLADVRMYKLSSTASHGTPIRSAQSAPPRWSGSCRSRSRWARHAWRFRRRRRRPILIVPRIRQFGEIGSVLVELAINASELRRRQSFRAPLQWCDREYLDPRRGFLQQPHVGVDSLTFGQLASAPAISPNTAIGVGTVGEAGHIINYGGQEESLGGVLPDFFGVLLVDRLVGSRPGLAVARSASVMGWGLAPFVCLV